MKKKDIDREYRKFIDNWLPKYTERLTMFLFSLKDKRDIKENDWESVKTAFRSYYMGYCPDFIPPWEPFVATPKQTTIFDSQKEDTTDKNTDTITQSEDGTQLEVVLAEPIITTNDTKKKVQKPNGHTR
jgi:hypothetical protein